MKPAYLTSMIQALAVNHPNIVKTETFEQVGAVGTAWPPSGLKITFADGTALFLSSSRTSTDGEDLTAQPDTFRPEDLHVPGV